jgi:hypothetical protein
MYRYYDLKIIKSWNIMNYYSYTFRISGIFQYLVSGKKIPVSGRILVIKKAGLSGASLVQQQF